MKKTIFLSAALILGTSGVFAREMHAALPAQGQGHMQPQGTVEERAKRMADRINATAQLSPDQLTKVADILKNYIGKRDALRSSGVTGDDLRAQSKELGKKQDAEIKKVLSADQYAKYEEAKKAHQGQGAPHGSSE